MTVELNSTTINWRRLRDLSQLTLISKGPFRCQWFQSIVFRHKLQGLSNLPSFVQVHWLWNDLLSIAICKLDGRRKWCWKSWTTKTDVESGPRYELRRRFFSTFHLVPFWFSIPKAHPNWEGQIWGPKIPLQFVAKRWQMKQNIILGVLGNHRWAFDCRYFAHTNSYNSVPRGAHSSCKFIKLLDFCCERFSPPVVGFLLL